MRPLNEAERQHTSHTRGQNGTLAARSAGGSPGTTKGSRMRSTKRHDRASALYRLLTSKRQAGYSLDELCGELQCSESTAKRLIRDLRNEYNHPIEFDQDRGGYFYNREQQAIGSFEMPGCGSWRRSCGRC